MAKPAGHPLHNHSLVSRWRLCKQFEERVGGALIGSAEEMLEPFVGPLLDAQMIQMLNDALGQPNPLFNRLASVFRDSRQFSDTMAEISAAAWCCSHKFPITPAQAMGCRSSPFELL